MPVSRRAALAVTALTFAAGVGSWYGIETLRPAEARPINVGGDQIAIRGYDPVAYFTLGAATPGDPEITYRWSDAVWQFSTTEHRDLFIADPETYAPAYGGYCAMGMADGFIANIDPNAWTIRDGRLYLKRSLARIEQWRSNAEAYIARAEENWAGDHAQLRNVWTEAD